MTIEEAIKHFESYVGNECYTANHQNACKMAIAALRAKQGPAKPGRSLLDGCDCCKGDLEGYTACFRDVNGRSRRIYIPEGEAAIVVPGKYNHKFCIPIKYCPFCGRPLTEEAWAELERRIGGNNETG